MKLQGFANRLLKNANIENIDDQTDTELTLLHGLLGVVHSFTL